MWEGISNVVGPGTALIIVWSEGEPRCCAVNTKTTNRLLYRDATCTHFGHSLYITCIRAIAIAQLHVAGSAWSKQFLVQILRSCDRAASLQISF